MRDPCSASTESAHAMSAARARAAAPGRARARGRRHELRAVDEREPLLRLQPHRLERRPGRAPRRPTAARPSTHASPSPTSGSARCASGARSPRRADRAAARHARAARRGRGSASRSSTVSTRAPELPLASAFARRSIAARTISSGYGSPTPQAWERSRRSWSSAVCSSGIERETNRPKPGVDAVGVLPAAVRGPLDELPGGAHPLAGRVGELGAGALDRDRPDVFDG